MFKNKVGLTILSSLLFITHSCFAIQDLVLSDDETLVGKISAKELNRITVQDDRILEIKSSQQAFNINQQFDVPTTEHQYETYKKGFYMDQNQETGEIYVKPAYADNRNSIDLFVTTEKNNIFSLSLVPSDIKAQTIRVNPPGATANTASVWEAEAPYQQTLINLIKAMRLGERIEGYRIQHYEDEPLKKSEKEGVQMRLLTTYYGNALKGEIYELANYTTSPVEIVESQVFSEYGRDNKSLATASTSRTVPSATFTQIYRVVSNEQ
jgi:type-F conjugative transfer system secretin TraK